MMTVFTEHLAQPPELTVDERLRRIQNYLTLTSDLHLKQVVFLQALEIFAPEERYLQAKGAFKQVVALGAETFGNALHDLKHDTKRGVVISRLSTGEQGELHALTISTDPLGYLGYVSLPDKTVDEWPIDSDIRLSLK
jgi:hypothetical protein